MSMAVVSLLIIQLQHSCILNVMFPLWMLGLGILTSFLNFVSWVGSNVILSMVK